MALHSPLGLPSLTGPRRFPMSPCSWSISLDPVTVLSSPGRCSGSGSSLSQGLTSGYPQIHSLPVFHWRGPCPAVHPGGGGLKDQGEWFYIHLLCPEHDGYFLSAYGLVPDFHHNHPTSCHLGGHPAPRDNMPRTEADHNPKRALTPGHLVEPEFSERALHPAAPCSDFSEDPAQ
jgi:hypothetical protein